VERPETRYARSGEVNLAYQVVGDGPYDLVLAPGFISNVEYGWGGAGARVVLQAARIRSRVFGEPAPREIWPRYPDKGVN
jgi:hypothetical protein